ncbi:MAG: hypothetical protein ABI986_12510, partial [Chloroflexota bacterium]
LPFLIPGLGLFAHRLWQYLLWIGLTAGAAVALSRRVFTSEERSIKWLAAGWIFLYLLRVGVYYHLELMVIIPLLFISGRHPWRTLIAVIIASIWAGISRVNWFPMPAMIAITIYLLETPLNSIDSTPLSLKQIVSYLSQPILWGVVGLASALLTQVAYVYISGNANNKVAFTSSFTSDLLWYRLWPNDNYSLGIIPAILLISGPCIAVMILAARQWKALHGLRWLGLIFMLAALFAGSVVVSVKIGGGGDLHDMDTYVILAAIVAFYFVGGHAQAEPNQALLPIRSIPVFAVAVITPVLFLIPLLSPYPVYNEIRNQEAYRQLIGLVNEAGKKGPVLFINDRELVTMGDVKVPLVYDYEAVTLMEMAMSGNQTYLQMFHNDLATHRFAAIVGMKQKLAIKQDGLFAEENNVWNTGVSRFILCYYTPISLIEPDGNNVEVYVPGGDPRVCPRK